MKRVTMLAVCAATVALAAAGCGNSNSSSSSQGGGGTSGSLDRVRGSGLRGQLRRAVAQRQRDADRLDDGRFARHTRRRASSTRSSNRSTPAGRSTTRSRNGTASVAKLNKALSSSTPPDVVELGNTQAVSYAQAGELADVTAKSNEFNCGQWNQALALSGAYQGKQYAVPFYGANRTVIYRKDMFAKAGITSPPASNAEWLTDIGKLKSAYSTRPGVPGAVPARPGLVRAAVVHLGPRR